MHSKAYFKFQFKSSRISTTSVHVIFFPNTTLHQDPNKIRTTTFGSTKLQIWILQNSLQTGINELTYEYTATDVWDPGVSRPHPSARRNRGGGFDGAATVELADGEDSGDAKATYVLYVMR